MLLEGTPSHISVAEVREAILTIPGVQDVHDLHIWKITAGLESLSAHVRQGGDGNRRALLEQLHQMLRDRLSIEHLTIQIEEEDLREQHLAE